MPIGRHVSRIAGFAPSLPTPFDFRGAVDLPAFKRLCALQVNSGASALVVGSITGEAPTLTPEEHRNLVAAGVSMARGLPVIAGAGSNSTAHAIELVQAAEAAGAAAVLSVVPYYNKPSQAGLYRHFAAIAASTALPIILYDVPARTACALSDKVVAQLAERLQFIALMDSTGDLTRISRLRALVRNDFRLLTSDDTTVLPFLVQGGDGCISVTSNIAPSLCRDLYLAIRAKHFAKAQRLADALTDLNNALILEPDPVPLKYALSLNGLCSPKVRLPMVDASLPTQLRIKDAMHHLQDCYGAIGDELPSFARVAGDG